MVNFIIGFLTPTPNLMCVVSKTPMKETLNQVATYLLFSTVLTPTNPGISPCLFGLALATSPHP
jgi:hypothetical protein